MAEKLWGHAPGGLYGYSSPTGGYAGGEAEYARIPFADVRPLKIENADLSDDQVLFLSGVFPTDSIGTEVCEITPSSPSGEPAPSGCLLRRPPGCSALIASS